MASKSHDNIISDAMADLLRDRMKQSQSALEEAVMYGTGFTNTKSDAADDSTYHVGDAFIYIFQQKWSDVEQYTYCDERKRQVAVITLTKDEYKWLS